jgi:hypothetical protein
MLDESVLESPREKVRATIGNGKPTGPSDDELRGQVRARLAEGRLPGRPCIVCRRAVEPIEVEREVTGCSGVVLTAHEVCYKPWGDESRAWPDLVAVGEAADRSRVTAGRRT